MLWTQRQRVGLLIIAGVILLILTIRYARYRAFIPDPQPELGARAGELAGRIDPNTADAAALAALPSIGPAVARRIVEDREAFLAVHPGELPYREPKDLLRVKGIGEATLSNLEPYFEFPTKPEGTGP
jgi:competence protein ComEA